MLFKIIPVELNELTYRLKFISGNDELTPFNIWWSISALSSTSVIVDDVVTDEIILAPPTNYIEYIDAINSFTTVSAGGPLTGANYPIESGILFDYTTSTLLSSTSIANITFSLSSELVSSSYIPARNSIGNSVWEISGYVTDTDNIDYYISGNVNPVTRAYELNYGNLPVTGIYFKGPGVKYPVGTFLNITGVPLENGPNIVASYQTNYGPYILNTPGNPLTTNQIQLKLNNYSISFLVSAYDTDTPSNSAFLFLSPYQVKFLEVDLFADYVSLSAYRSGITNVNINPLSYQNIRWTVSDPISATMVKSGSTIYIDSSVTLPTVSGDYLTFTSDYPTSKTYYISAEIPNISLTVPQYTFNYDPVVSDGLKIEKASTIDGFNSTFILRRTVLGESGIIYDNFKINPVSTIAWGINPNDSIIGFYRLSGYDIEPPYTTVSDYSLNDYGTLLTLHSELNTGVLSSIAIMATAVPGDSQTAYVSTYQNYIGGDVTQLSANSGIVTTYALCAYYFNEPTISAVYTYVPSFPTTNIEISALGVNDYTLVKNYILKGVNPYLGQIADINPTDIIGWTVSSLDDPNLDNIWATYPNGIPYTFTASSQAGSLNTLIFYVSSPSTSTSPPSPNTYVVTLCSENGLYTDNYDISAYEFPANNIFDLEFKINNENPRDVNYSMWRLTNAAYQVRATDLSNITYLDSNDYTRKWDWGDGSITETTSSVAEHIYNVPSLTTVTINFSALNVPMFGLISASKVASDYMDITFVPRFLSATFIAYPDIVFPVGDPSNPIDLSPTNFTQSQGVCAYGEGHAFIVNLSATEPGIVTLDGTNYTNTFIWNYNTTPKTVIGSNITDTDSTFETSPPTTLNPAGTAITLTIYNDIFPTTMVSAHTGDNGALEIYPNFNGTTDDASILTQNIRIFPYETASAAIVSWPDKFIIQEKGLSATEVLVIPSFSPVEIVSRICNWTISNGIWSASKSTSSQDNNSANLLYTIVKGNQNLAGTLPEGQVNILTLELSGTATEKIYNYDYEESDKQFAATPITSISAYVMPEILIYTDNNFALTGGQVTFENVTNQNPEGLISAWQYDPGDGNIYTKSDFSPLTVTYSEAGIYSLSVSAIAFTGYVETRVFPNLVTASTDYELYRSDIIRTYNVSEFKLPYSCNKNILLPPNEWVTADNINAAFDRLNTNLNYISAVSKIYNSPPSYYYGWFGTSGVDTDAKWHVNILGLSAGVNDGFISATNTHLDNVYDIAVNTELMYIANNTTLQLLSADYSGTLVAETSTKAVGDPFAKIQAVDIDSDGKIYVLDSPKNRVVVLEYNSSSLNPWKLKYSWGGFGGATAKTKFRNPSDLFVDTNKNVWVVDKDNLVVKKYSKSGGWIDTIESDLFTETNKPISITKDLDNNLHILTNNYVVKLTESGMFIKTYTYTNAGINEPKRIIHHVNDGFIYICLENLIVRMQKNGTPAGTFGNNGAKYTGIYQNSDQDIFTTTSNAVLKYNDKISILDAMIDMSSYLWDMNDIYIDDNEYVSDWVYNKSLARMWDNIDILKRSLKGKISVSTNPITNKTTISIRNFTVEEYNDLLALTSKDEIYIGVNEFVTADVINRNLSLLCNMLNTILNNIT